MIKILSWDWKADVSLDELAKALADLTDGKIRLYEVDTDSDQVGIALSDQPLDDAAVKEAWERQWDR